MTYDSRPDLLALHAVRVKGFAATTAVAEATGMTEQEAESELAAAAEAGLASYRDGAICGWCLTPAGREHHRRLLDDEARETGYESDLSAGYEAFVPLNEPFKVLCTEWQTENQPAGCVERLAELHDQVIPTVEMLATAATRFGRYVDRFDAALKRLQDGDGDAFTKPLCGSYHDIWMELHQDLLLTLNRERAAADGH